MPVLPPLQGMLFLKWQDEHLACRYVFDEKIGRTIELLIIWEV